MRFLDHFCLKNRMDTALSCFKQLSVLHHKAIALQRILLAGGLSALLAACATVPTPATAPGTSPATTAAQARTGRISVRAPDERGTVQTWHAGFEFVEQQDRRSLRLTNPLGNTVADIQADAQGARLTTANGEQHRYASLAQLTQQLTGVALPDTAWRYWLQGMPAPDEAATQSEAGKFVQNGFMVNIVSRFGNHSPRVLEITRPDAPELLVRVALEVQ
jgi:outer membrane lipoprotein LolB